MLLTNMASVLPHVSSGKLKAIGVSSLRRSDAAPQVPTISESGLSRFEYTTWYSMVVPAATTPRLVDHVHASVVQVLSASDVAQRFMQQGLHIHASGPADFGRYLRAELARWKQVVTAATLHVD